MTRFFTFLKKPLTKQATTLFEDSLSLALSPHLYAELGVPDTFDGRFDCLMLHLCPIFNSLNNPKLAQRLYDVTFSRLEFALRETGTGDAGVAKKVRHMMKAFYGRLNAYNSAQNDNEWATVLRRNLYGTITDPNFTVPPAMILYAQSLMNPKATTP